MSGQVAIRPWDGVVLQAHIPDLAIANCRSHQDGRGIHATLLRVFNLEHHVRVYVRSKDIEIFKVARYKR